MNRYALSLIPAAVLAASCVAGANAQAVLARCDKPMADAESMVNQVAACAGTLSRASAAQSASPVITEATKDIVDAATAKDFSVELINHAAFSAYAAGDIGACAPQPFPGWDSRCREIFLEMRAARAAAGPRAEFVKACVLLESPRTQAEIKKETQCCQSYAANIGRPDACAAMSRECTTDQQDCRSFLSSLDGDAGACVPSSDPAKAPAERDQLRVQCLGTAHFVKAFRAKDAKLCGTSDFCRVLMGQGKQVVRERTARLNKTPAGRWYVSRVWAAPAAPAPAPASAAAAAKFATTIRGFTCQAPLNSPANLQATSAVLASARTCFGDVELALSKVDAAMARALDDREEKLIRLGLLLEKHFAAAVPAKTGR